MVKAASRQRRGFTLVELLIVLIIIGILAGALMLAAGHGTDKATATRIVSDLRNIKAGAMMYYADNTAWPTTDAALASVDNYVDRQVSGGSFHLLQDGSGHAFAGYAGPMGSGVVSSLKAMATDSGLLGSANATTAPTAAYNGEAVVWLRLN